MQTSVLARSAGRNRGMLLSRLAQSGNDRYGYRLHAAVICCLSRFVAKAVSGAEVIS
jgi:hypothetical protein